MEDVPEELHQLRARLLLQVRVHARDEPRGQARAVLAAE